MDDWRLMGQEDYLKNKQLKENIPFEFAKTKEYPQSWHEHCEFCGEKATADVKGEFYSTEDDYYWICKSCFDDFKEKFNWIVKN